MALWWPRIDQTLERYGYKSAKELSIGTIGGGHWHEGLEINIIHSGVMHVSLQQQQRTLKPGDVVILDGRAPHATRPISGPYVRTAHHFAPDLLTGKRGSQLLAEVESNGGALFYTLTFEAAYRVMWASQQLDMFWRKAKTHPAVRDLLGLVVSDLQALRTAPPLDETESIVQSVVEYMRANTHSNERLSDIAAKFFISENHLRRIFTVYVGCTPHKYWLRLKLEQACEYLAGPLPIKQIAAQVGFDSLNGFERAFRQEMGLTPSEYRQNYRG